MPHSHLSHNKWRALIAIMSAIVALMSVALLHAGAQGIRPASRQIAAPAPANAYLPQQRKKNIVKVQSTDTPNGSRVMIFADVPLNDYEAYSQGNRFIVVIPDAEGSRLQNLLNTLRGRGFDDVKAQKVGADMRLSFRLQAGMKARIEQKFNRLDVVFTAPGPVKPTGETPLGTITRNNQVSPEVVNQQTNPSGNTSNYPGSNAMGNTASTAGTTRRRYPRSYGSGGGTSRSASSFSDWSGGTPTGTADATDSGMPPALPSPTTDASPGFTASTDATASPTPVEQIAQANQPPTGVPPTTTTAPTTTSQPQPATSTGLAAAFRNNWLLILIGALVLITIGLVLASRSKAREESEARRVEAKGRVPLKDAPRDKSGVAAAAATGAAVATAAAKATKAERAPAKDKAAPTKEIEPKVDTAKAEAGVKKLLAGESYDEAVIGASAPAVRQHVAAELLAALAGRNPERRERAREAFIKHGYQDEATRDLRTAQAPAERASAARSLGLVRDKAATPHLVAALDDKNAEVRRAAVGALAEVQDPAAIAPLNSLLKREKDRKVPHSLIRRAIEASATVETKAVATPPAPADAKAKSAPEKGKTKAADEDDSDREVFEI